MYETQCDWISYLKLWIRRIVSNYSWPHFKIALLAKCSPIAVPIVPRHAMTSYPVVLPVAIQRTNASVRWVWCERAQQTLPASMLKAALTEVNKTLLNIIYLFLGHTIKICLYRFVNPVLRRTHLLLLPKRENCRSVTRWQHSWMRRWRLLSHKAVLRIPWYMLLCW